MMIGLAVCLTVGTVAQGAGYGYVQLRYRNVSPTRAVKIWIPGQSGSYYSGQYNVWVNQTAGTYGIPPGYPDPPEGEMTVPELLVTTAAANGGWVGTYCSDMFQDTPSSWTEYTIVDTADAPVGAGQTAMGAEKAGDIAQLFDRYYASAVNNVTCAAFQACVWEIIYEDPTNSYNVGSGDAYMAHYYGGDTWLDTLAQPWLDSLTDAYTYVNIDPADVKAMVDCNYQDFAVFLEGAGGVPPIPEPVTVFGLFLGLGAAAKYVRGRR
jgi:hypothetical protein